jgi:alcohol dehydrogenase class IV
VIGGGATFPMRFEFATAGRVIFGPGVLREVGPLAREFGPRALVVTGGSPRRAESLLSLLSEHGVVAVAFPVAGEPELETVRQGVALARKESCGLVISFGGGSALDAGKAIAAMLANTGELLDYLEVIGRGKTLAEPSVPFIAIPTTAGTGSEVTRNAVLASPAHGVKVSLRSPFLLPRAALVDPELTYGLPPSLTASTGLDALTQLIEPFVCARTNPMTDALCREGIRRAARSLRMAFADGRNAAAREDMSLASLFGGLALANAGLGAVHGFAGPIGGQFPAPHGAVCAALLPHVMEANLRTLRQRQPEADTLSRYGEVASLMTGNANAPAEAGVEWVRALVADLKIPGLGHYGLKRDHSAELVAKASHASSMRANPIVLRPDELAGILERAL